LFSVARWGILRTLGGRIIYPRVLLNRGCAGPCRCMRWYMRGVDSYHRRLRAHRGFMALSSAFSQLPRSRWLDIVLPFLPFSRLPPTGCSSVAPVEGFVRVGSGPHGRGCTLAPSGGFVFGGLIALGVRALRLDTWRKRIRKRSLGQPSFACGSG